MLKSGVRRFFFNSLLLLYSVYFQFQALCKYAIVVCHGTSHLLPMTCNILFLPHECQPIQKAKWNSASTSHMSLWRFSLALFTCTLEMEHFAMGEGENEKWAKKNLQYIDYVRLVDYLTRVWKHRSTHVILCQCYSCAFMFQQHLRMEFTQQIILMISHFRAFYAPSLSIYP